MRDFARNTHLKVKAIEALNASLVDELNIYHQAYLTLDSPLITSKRVHLVTKYEKVVSFKIDGDINAEVFCIIDTFKKVITKEDEKLFSSICTESMNILIGKIITNLENNYYISTMIDSPKMLSTKLTDEVLQDESSGVKLSMGYILSFNQQEFNCRIVLNIRS